MVTFGNFVIKSNGDIRVTIRLYYERDKSYKRV